jgi:sulfatase maturation enzyme AslB (radical SAM superfamily)
MSEPETQSLTPERFVAIAVSVVTRGMDEDFDTPELWAAIARYPAADLLLLREHIDHAALPVDDEGRLHPRTRDALLMVANLIDHHLGRLDGVALLGIAEGWVVRNSQAAIVAGYAFHVRHLLDPENPIYDLARYACPTPFEQLDVLEKSSHLCCRIWLKRSVGDLSTTPYDEVWSSEAATEIRASVLDGSFRYCNKLACPLISAGRLPTKDELGASPFFADVLRRGTGETSRLPIRINLAYDPHCNLSCPSCRTGLVTSDEAVRVRLDALTQKNIYPLLASAKEVFVTGSGDPFASRTFRTLLSWISDETCPDLQVILTTNGMLLTEDEWRKFPNLRGKVKAIKVSLDGASKTSHELIRRRSRWDVMTQNLPFIGRLLEGGEIGAFAIIFVVQRDNFREMGAFVDLAGEIGASQVIFERLINWGAFSSAEYAERAVHASSHPLHGEFLEHIADPRLGDPKVFLASLAEFLPSPPA